MHALKTPSFLRPSSRSSSPVPLSRPDSGVGLEPTHPLTRPSSRGPLNRLALTSRKRPIVAPTPPSTPTLVQDGSYLEALSLKLSEAVSKALAQPTGVPAAGEILVHGKRALPNGRGTALGALIASELEASTSNSHLNRAILRSLHRPLSVLLTNLSAQLLPLISSPQFMAHPSPTAPSSAQLHALAYATFAAELLESFNAHGLWQTEHPGAGLAADNLRGISEGLESLIGRVINPLAHGMKQELFPLIEALEQTLPCGCPPTPAKQGAGHPKGPPAPLHPSIVTLQNLVPLHVRNLTRYTTPPSTTSQTMLATLSISLIWRSLVALSHRIPIPPVNTVPQVAPLQLAGRKKRLGSSTTPPTTPPSTRFTIKLPPSRPPSPPTPQVSSPAGDARVLYGLLSALPRPNSNNRYALAREAVDEAYGSLAALCALLDIEAIEEDLEDLDVVTADLPTVIALPVLFRIFASHGQDERDDYPSQSVPSLLGLTEQEYRDACLSGFGRAEECGPLVAKRVLDALLNRQHADTRWDRVIQWLEGRANLAE